MTVLPLRRRPSPERAADQTIRDFQSETAEFTEAPDPFSARMTVWLLVLMLVLAFGVSTIVTYDRVVTADGKVVSQTPTLVVQPLETSIVRSINVRNGQNVRRGDVLVTLDPTFTGADVAQLESKMAAYAAEIARLQAEAEGQTFVVTKDSKPDMILQESIWRYRMAEYRARILNFEQRIATAQETIRRNVEDAKYLQSRLEVLTTVEEMRRTLERNQTGSKLNSLSATDSRLEVRRSLASAQNVIQSAQHDMEALKAEKDVFIQQWRSSILSDLAQRQVDMGQVIEDRSKAVKRQELVELRAHDDATVLEIAPVSVGSVIQSASKLLTLVPNSAPLEIEAELAGSDQGYIKVGDPVKIKFSAYKYIEHGMAEGTVRVISGDSFTTKDDGQRSAAPFYRARIDIKSVNLRNVPEDFKLVPGMPVTADIVVGSRTLMNYFLEGMFKSSLEAMREP